MDSKQFQDIAREASKLLNDSYDCDPQYDFTRWSQTELVHYAKDGLRMIASLYPKKFTTTKTITLKKGKVQVLEDGCRIMKVLGAKGGEATSSIANAVSERLAELFPGGCSESLTQDADDYEVESFSIEETSESVFYVYPPAPRAGIEIDVIVFCYPDVDNKDFVVPVWAHNAIIEWVLYRAYSSEDESAQNVSNASTHLQHFYSMLQNIIQSSELHINVSSGAVPQMRNEQ